LFSSHREQLQIMNFGIALGSNLGDRAENVRRGIEMILARVPGVRLNGSGRVYETEPVDCAPGTQAFLNTVIEVAADCKPEELHAVLKGIEAALGRPEQRERNSPRTLDLDLLYADEVVSDDPVLTLPHPRMHLRRFVLEPLADIRPELVLPGQSETVATLLLQLEEHSAK
jgi:2-amino-4-hydroxy-6-hydroxymethyldihydropteridine diphosphokinase